MLREQPQGAKLMVTGYLKVNLVDLEGDHMEEELAATMNKEGI